MQDIHEAADCIEGTNTLVEWKIAFAQRLRDGQIDLLSLENIERDARRQIQACNTIKRLAKVQYEKVD